MSRNVRYWITPDGTDKIFMEHALVALRKILEIPEDRAVPSTWYFGVPKEILEDAAERGVDPKAIEYMAGARDPRVYAMAVYGWIRIAKQKDILIVNVWRWNDASYELLLSSDLWDKERWPDTQVVQIEAFEPKASGVIETTLGALMKRRPVIGAPGAAKQLAAEERVGVRFDPKKYGERERRELYKREGDNPEGFLARLKKDLKRKIWEAEDARSVAYIKGESQDEADCACMEAIEEAKDEYAKEKADYERIMADNPVKESHRKDLTERAIAMLNAATAPRSSGRWKSYVEGNEGWEEFSARLESLLWQAAEANGLTSIEAFREKFQKEID